MPLPFSLFPLFFPPSPLFSFPLTPNFIRVQRSRFWGCRRRYCFFPSFLTLSGTEPAAAEVQECRTRFSLFFLFSLFFPERPERGQRRKALSFPPRRAKKGMVSLFSRIVHGSFFFSSFVSRRKAVRPATFQIPPPFFLPLFCQVEEQTIIADGGLSLFSSFSSFGCRKRRMRGTRPPFLFSLGADRPGVGFFFLSGSAEDPRGKGKTYEKPSSLPPFILEG